MQRATVIAVALVLATPFMSSAFVPERPPGIEYPMTSENPDVVLASTSNASFDRWISSFRGRALNQGIRAQVFDAAFQGVRYNSDVIERDRNQSEFTKQIWEYLDSAVSDTRVKNGRAALRDHKRVLDEIEARYGVVPR